MRRSIIIACLIILGACESTAPPSPFDYCTDIYDFPTRIERIPGHEYNYGPCPETYQVR